MYYINKAKMVFRVRRREIVVLAGIRCSLKRVEGRGRTTRIIKLTWVDDVSSGYEVTQKALHDKGLWFIEVLGGEEGAGNSTIYQKVDFPARLAYRALVIFRNLGIL